MKRLLLIIILFLPGCTWKKLAGPGFEMTWGGTMKVGCDCEKEKVDEEIVENEIDQRETGQADNL